MSAAGRMGGALRPLGATAAWDAVMVASDGRCTCAGECGTGHTRTDGRCPRELARRHRLYAAPADPAVPADRAWRAARQGEDGASGPGLVAWCGPCLDGARRRAAAAARATRTAGEASTADPSLLDLLAPEPATTAKPRRRTRKAAA